MAAVYAGLLDSTSVESLRKAGFGIRTDDIGWIAEYTAGRHRIRVEAVPGGWFVSQVLVAGSVEWVKSATHHEEFAVAVRSAVELVGALNARLRLVGSVAGPLLAELQETS
jgi:hypothetical protein